MAILDTDDVEFLVDPHATFDRLRAEHWSAADGKGISLLSYEACEAAFHDPVLVPGIDRLLESMGFGYLWGIGGHTLTDSEGADHQRLRRAVSPWFTARRIDGLRERTRGLVAEVIGEHAADDRIEVMADLANRIPARLFCWMVGADPGDAEQLARWSQVLLSVFTESPEIVEPVRAAKQELSEYTSALLAGKRQEPADDLASVLAAAEQSGQIGAEDATCLLDELLGASVDNTANTAALALLTLAEHPDQWRALHADPGLLNAAVEECGRYEPTVRHTLKFATADTELLGEPIAAGTFVTIRVAAAHRDPAAFPDPHRFDVRRSSPRSQLAFGAGRHYCLGAALAKMEVQEIVSALTSRWPTASVGAGADMDIATSGTVRALPLERAAHV